MAVKLPEVIGIGPPRTGSTWLHRVLEGRVDLPWGVKETQFFSNYYDRGIDWYARHFRYASGERPIVEICPTYFFKGEARERIKVHIPHCRCIATLRDPVERVYSMYKMVRHFAFVRSGTFDQVLRVQPDLGSGNRYALHLKAWFEAFGRENVLVTMFDELRARPQAYLDRITDFIGVERISLSERGQIGDDVYAFARAPRNRRLARRATTVMNWLNARQAYRVVNALDRLGVWEFCHGRGEPFPRLEPEQEARLRERYLPEVEAVEELLRIDLSAWKKPRARSAAETSAGRPVQRSANG